MPSQAKKKTPAKKTAAKKGETPKPVESKGSASLPGGENWDARTRIQNVVSNLAAFVIANAAAIRQTAPSPNGKTATIIKVSLLRSPKDRTQVYGVWVSWRGKPSVYEGKGKALYNKVSRLARRLGKGGIITSARFNLSGSCGFNVPSEEKAKKYS